MNNERKKYDRSNKNKNINFETFFNYETILGLFTFTSRNL